MEEHIITAAQLATRDEWDKRLMRKECTLADALAMTLHLGVPASAYLVARYEAAIETYKAGVVDDLAEPFGIAMGKREKNAMERETTLSNTRFHVDEFHAQGFQKVDPSKFEDTAFHKTGELLGMSAQTAFKQYYKLR